MPVRALLALLVLPAMAAMVVASDKVLGDVVRGDLDSYVARPTWRGREVSAHLMVEKNSPPDGCIAIARDIVEHLDTHVAAGHTVAAHALSNLQMNGEKTTRRQSLTRAG